MIRLVLVWGVIASLLSGCEGMGAQKRANTLEQTLNEYRILMRWGQFEEAARYIRFRPGHGELKQLDLKPLKQIRLASYDVVEQIVDTEQPVANIKVVMTYYHEESNVLHTLRQAQHWWYDEQNKRWYLEAEFPDFIGNMQRDR